MTTIETNGRTLVVLEVPKADRDKSNFSISEHGNLFGISKHGELMQCDTYINLTGYNVIGILSELTAGQCEPYIENGNYTDGQECWKNYLEDGAESYHFLNAHRSIYTLLIKNGLDTTKPLLIIEKIK